MKLASILYRDEALYGQVKAGIFYPAPSALAVRYPTLKALIMGGALDQLKLLPTDPSGGLNLDQVTFQTPIPDAGKIICVGMNYRKLYPVDGVAPPDPSNIIIFGKERETLIGHGQTLDIPTGDAAKSFDYEGEIAVVIGKSGRHIQEDAALEHVLGYSVLNDGSVREWQKHSIYAGKNFAGSGAWGPWICTADEIGDPAKLRLTTDLNGVRMQDTTADQMIYSIAAQISYASHLFTLAPGDVIATGSPDGTGGSRTPKRYLRAGDTLEITVSDVGCLRNTISLV